MLKKSNYYISNIFSYKDRFSLRNEKKHKTTTFTFTFYIWIFFIYLNFFYISVEHVFFSKYFLTIWTPIFLPVWFSAIFFFKSNWRLISDVQRVHVHVNPSSFYSGVVNPPHEFVLFSFQREHVIPLGMWKEVTLISLFYKYIHKL